MEAHQPELSFSDMVSLYCTEYEQKKLNYKKKTKKLIENLMEKFQKAYRPDMTLEEFKSCMFKALRNKRTKQAQTQKTCVISKATESKEVVDPDAIAKDAEEKTLLRDVLFREDDDY